MNSNTLHGTWDRLKGYGSELWGEVTGNDALFARGLRQRMIGRLESYQDLSQEEAEKRVESLM